jgi:chromosome segregation ATPase
MTEEQKREQSKPEAVSESEAAPRLQKETSSDPSIASRALRWVFRMLATILLGIALGAAIYYGASSFYRDAIEPLQTIDQRVREMEANVSDLNETVREQRSSTAEEIDELQGKISVQVEELASISAQLARLELQLEDQASTLDEIEELENDLALVEQNLEQAKERLQTLEDLVEAGELPAERVQETLQLTRVMNLMTRARLWIEQDNFGLADQDIQVALEIMEPLAVEADPDSAIGSRLQEISDRLAAAADTVRSEPGLAEEELEIIWKLLIEASAP